MERVANRSKPIIVDSDAIDNATLSKVIQQSYAAMLAAQHKDGFWCFELEADCTIPAEYIMMMHFIGDIKVDIQRKLANYLKEHQSESGGWPLFYGGKPDLSCSVKAYFALKLAGDDVNDLHMQKARKVILQLGGAAKSNVFTRISLAFFGQVPWRAIPFMPVEAVLLPSWFPVHPNKISYWSRTVMIPLLILYSLNAKAKNPTNTKIRELFVIPPEQEKKYHPVRSRLNKIFLALDRVGHYLERFIPHLIRNVAIKKAERWCIDRLNGEHGLGAIFPAKVNVYQAFFLLGYEISHPYMQQTRKALDKLLVDRGHTAYCQPCLSPVWDTALASMAMHEVDRQQSSPAVQRACDWLKGQQLLEVQGDWAEKRPGLPGGGWPFQFSNDYYPDLDDTALVAWVMDQMEQPERYATAVNRAVEWLKGMQCKNGGFAAFDVDNTHYYLNEIPFADHGALLDPPTCDVSARCAGLLGRLNRPEDRQCLQKCLEYVRSEQEENGSWFGRWGTNYIYGTWSVLSGFEQVQGVNNKPYIQKAVSWLISKQHADGGWGEDNNSYYSEEKYNDNEQSTAFQTALALLGLMAAGEVKHAVVRKGIEYLLKHQQQNGFWDEPWFTAPGFPRVFYLKYHGYSKYFPLWALARYRNLIHQEDVA